MYKKITLLSFLVCAVMFSASNASSWMEIKPGYFLFSASPMDTIYHNGFQIQGSVSLPFYDYIDFYTSIGYRRACGRTLTTGEKTTLAVVPFDIGVKPVFNLNEYLDCFIAIGPRFFHIHQDNNSPYVNRVLVGNGFGFFATTGLNLFVKDAVLLGVFGEYSYEKKMLHSTMHNVFSNGDIQMGGFVFGVSLGYVF